MCGGSLSLMGICMTALILGGTYAITTFGPKISLKAMKAKIKNLNVTTTTSQPNHIIITKSSY